MQDDKSKFNRRKVLKQLGAAASVSAGGIAAGSASAAADSDADRSETDDNPEVEQFYDEYSDPRSIQTAFIRYGQDAVALLYREDREAAQQLQNQFRSISKGQAVSEDDAFARVAIPAEESSELPTVPIGDADTRGVLQLETESTANSVRLLIEPLEEQGHIVVEPKAADEEPYALVPASHDRLDSGHEGAAAATASGTQRRNGHRVSLSSGSEISTLSDHCLTYTFCDDNDTCCGPQDAWKFPTEKTVEVCSLWDFKIIDEECGSTGCDPIELCTSVGF